MSAIFRASDKPVEITCGIMRKIIGKEDCGKVDFADIEVLKETKRHYHKRLTEFYYVLSGALKVELDGKMHEAKQGELVMITPGTKHKAWGKAHLLVVCCPPWEEKDEIVVE
jgi:mannose-6-phosphate isomerase-like protein (cupin superfamily)